MNRAVPLPAVAFCAARSQAELLDRIAGGDWDRSPGTGDWRVAIVNPDAERIRLASRAVSAGQRWQGRRQVFFSAQPLLSTPASGQHGKVAFLFPGVDSTFAPRADDIAEHLQLPLAPSCRPADPGTELALVVRGVSEFNRFTLAVMQRLGIRADVLAGHSIGEWDAMVAAGVLDRERIADIITWLETGCVQLPDVRFLSVACDRATVAPLLAGSELALSHDNCPHQVIVCGRSDAIDRFREHLRARNILSQPLPIVSGFHSPFLADYLAPYRDFFCAEPFRPASVPLWSCTTAQPFADGAAGQQLAVEHLVQPVAFRQLVDNLYAAGVRAFIQLGTGSLPGFVQDTLHDRPHLALAVNSEKCSGLEQLCRLTAALWVEGYDFEPILLQPPPESAKATAPVAQPQPAPTPVYDTVPTAEEFDDPVDRHFAATLAEIRRIGDDIAALWQRRRDQRAAASAAPSRAHHHLRRHLDVDSTIRCVLDHCLYPQREGWPSLVDRRPVVPLTMMLALLREAIAQQFPGQVVIGFEEVHAHHWLCVDQPVAIDIHIDASALPLLSVRIDGYLDARAVVAAAYPSPPPVDDAPLSNPRHPRIDARALYRDRWMFHGPAYQGVLALGPVGDNGLDGRLYVPEGSGALLDNMGQLAGYWVMEQPEQVLAMPVGIERVNFYAPEPPVGAEFDCRIRIRHVDAESCVSDQLLFDPDGSVRVAMTGWRTRRYDMSREFYLRSCQLEKAVVCVTLEGGVLLFEDRYDTALMRDYLARRYLNEPELAIYDALPPRRRRSWLNGRIAAKDAVRDHLWRRRGALECYPKEIRIDSDGAGAPQVQAHQGPPFAKPVYVSIAHKDHLAVALAGARPVGVDIERIEPRTPEFMQLAFTAQERRMLPQADTAAWIARLWAAKEAAAKLRGTGLQGRPQDYPINDVAGPRVLVGRHWIHTSVHQYRHHNDDQSYAMGWAENDETS